MTVKVDPTKSLLVLTNLEFLDASPVERGDIRVQPERRINGTLLHNKIKLLDAVVANISESSIAFQAKLLMLKNYCTKTFWTKNLTLNSKFQTDKSFLTKICTKATIFSVINEMVVLSIQPSVFMKSKSTIRRFKTKWSFSGFKTVP